MISPIAPDEIVRAFAGAREKQRIPMRRLFFPDCRSSAAADMLHRRNNRDRNAAGRATGRLDALTVNAANLGALPASSWLCRRISGRNRGAKRFRRRNWPAQPGRERGAGASVQG
jgi:hypothetical protein